MIEIAGLLPHRPPFVLVDAVEAVEAGPPPSLRAVLRVPVDHPIFAAHFPGRPMWPGVYTIEGLAQCCLLLARLSAPTAGTAAAGVTATGVLGGVEIKLLAPVLPGARLDYSVRATHAFGAAHRFEVEARVEGQPVARGALTVAMGA